MNQDSPEPPIFRGVPVKGCRYHGFDACLSRTDPAGTGYLLEREPANAHDANAIRVLTEEGAMTGYVAREYAAAIAGWMDRGWVFFCTKQTRVGCWNVVKLEPLKAAPAVAETTVEAPVEGDKPKVLEPVDLMIREVIGGV